LKYYIIAGEASGDLHGSNLVKALRAQDSHADIRAWGGDRMVAAGATVVKHIRELAFMGFSEVVMNLRTILGNIDFCKKDILAFAPDVVVLVDYPGFNMRLLPFLKENNIKVVYYISPQLWAWKEGRVEKIKKYVDKMLVIFPFEVDFYAKHNMKAVFVGHPLLDEINHIKSTTQQSQTTQKTIALLPGSRKQEISKMLPLYDAVSKHFPGYRFVVAGMSVHGSAYYQSFIQNPQIEIIMDSTYDLLRQADAALVTSGTATMETALFGVPQVVCYKGSPVSYFIGRMLVKVPFIAMVNLVCEKRVVEELIQGEANEANTTRALKLLFEPDNRSRMQSEYEMLLQKLGGSGASANAARETIALLK
jgi:lipid-A-disaccharide synthase